MPWDDEDDEDDKVRVLVHRPKLPPLSKSEMVDPDIRLEASMAPRELSDFERIFFAGGLW